MDLTPLAHGENMQLSYINICAASKQLTHIEYGKVW